MFFQRSWLVIWESARMLRYALFVLVFALRYGFWRSTRSRTAVTARVNRFLHGGQHWFYRDAYRFAKVVDSAELRRRGGYFQLFGTVHETRIELVKRHLPAARRIVDVGGASGILPQGGLYQMEYPHRAEKLVIVDLPHETKPGQFASADRQSVYRDGIFAEEIVHVHTTMTDLSSIADGWADLVWSGQSIEHITEDEGRVLFREVRRVLRPGGAFCLDTPNHRVARLLRPDAFLDGDHKLEYRPAQLKGNILAEGFEFVRALAVVPMPLSVRAGKFLKLEAYHGLRRFSDTPDEGFAFFLHFRTPG